jgi:hypothetical protein
MRCHKCGFISFDHLSECKRCGVSLIAIRDGLGMMPFKPDVPSLLGSLLGESDKKSEEMISRAPAGDTSSISSTAHISEPQSGSIDLLPQVSRGDVIEENLVIELPDDDLQDLLLKLEKDPEKKLAEKVSTGKGLNLTREK